MFTLDDQQESPTAVIRQYWTSQGMVKGFLFSGTIPKEMTFANRRLSYSVIQGSKLIILEDEILRALDWKVADEITWTVYSDRTNFFKVEI